MMKNLMGFAILFLSFGTVEKARALEPLDWDLLSASGVSLVLPTDLIDWNVGDSMSYNVSLAGYGSIGTTTKVVTRDEGSALWVRETMNLMIQNEVIEILISKADGKVIKLIRNGKEQPVPNDRLEIISQKYEQVTVPKGTFQSLHIVAKTKNISKLEVWVNPQDTAMDGALKQVMATQMGDLTLELTDFKHGQSLLR